MISANEARATTETVIKHSNTYELTIIEDMISATISQGGFSVSIEGVPSVGVSDMLKRLGYTVKTSTQYNESFTAISW